MRKGKSYGTWKFKRSNQPNGLHRDTRKTLSSAQPRKPRLLFSSHLLNWQRNSLLLWYQFHPSHWSVSCSSSVHIYIPYSCMINLDVNVTFSSMLRLVKWSHFPSKILYEFLVFSSGDMFWPSNHSSLLTLWILAITVQGRELFITLYFHFLS